MQKILIKTHVLQVCYKIANNWKQCRLITICVVWQFSNHITKKLEQSYCMKLHVMMNQYHTCFVAGLYFLNRVYFYGRKLAHKFLNPLGFYNVQFRILNKLIILSYLNILIKQQQFMLTMLTIFPYKILNGCNIL